MMQNIVNLLPSVPSGMGLTFGSMYSLFDKINYYLPITEIFGCIALYVVLLNWRLGFNFIKWLAERIVI
jgi:hypothetical protein